MYSIAETAKANGLNPYWYMKHVLEEMLNFLIQAAARQFSDSGCGPVVF